MVDTGTLLSCEDVATVSTFMAVAAVLRGDGIMGNLSLFSDCKLTIESMITSNKALTISSTALVFNAIGYLIVIAVALLITFKDVLTPDCVWWRNGTTFFIMRRQEVYTAF